MNRSNAFSACGELGRALQPLDLELQQHFAPALLSLATHSLWHYNHEGPNMGLGGITSVQKLAMVA